jgi:Glycosyltransferase family 87
VQQSAGQGLNGRPRAVAVTALLATCLVFGVWLAFAAQTNSPVDFYVYYTAGALARSDRSFYAISIPEWVKVARELGVTHITWPYRYPPYTAALASLLVPLGPFRAMVVWGVANAVALVAGAVVLGIALGGRWRLPLAVAVLVFFGPAYHTLFDGQVNGLVFFSLAVAFWGLARGRDLPLGVGIAFAAALKLTPVALLAYLAWRRRWRALLVAIAALAALTAATLPVTGPSDYVQYVHRAYALTDPLHVNPSGANQSATGALGRLLLPSATKVDSGSATRTVQLLAQVFAAALLAATAFVTWPRRRTDDGRPAQRAARDGELLGFGMVVAATLVIGSFTWYHQFTWLLIPLLLVACRLIVARRWWLVAALGVLILGIDANELLWTRLHQTVIESGVYRGLSLPFVAAIVVWTSAAAMIAAGRVGRGLERRGGLLPRQTRAGLERHHPGSRRAATSKR